MKGKIKYILYAVVLVWLTISCSETITDELVQNQAPDTFIFLNADENAELNQQKSRLLVHWWGDDPDGLVLGYFFRWEGLDNEWSFTTKNDSLFSLPIGTVDTTFTFVVYAVDSEGNGRYDSEIIQNGISYGSESFKDRNGNGAFDEGEIYFDVGLADPSPAMQPFPIKNSAPTIEWSAASELPAESFPVMTIGWSADDLDGTESIVKIILALNDTTNFVELERNINLVTLRGTNLQNEQAAFELLLNGSETNINEEQLGGLRLDASNRLFVQAVDISGARSAFIPLPDTAQTWIVRNPKGNLLIVDDMQNGNEAANYYQTAFSSINNGSLSNKFDVFDIESTELPFPNITFLETLKLFKYVYWYSDSDPSLDFLNLVTQKFVESGGKIAFSLTFRDSSSTFEYDLISLQNFLPIAGFNEESAISFMFSGANLSPTQSGGGFPALVTASTIGSVHSLKLSNISIPVYNVSSAQVNGSIAVINSPGNVFFIGLPLHQCNSIEGSVEVLLEHLFFDEFGLSP